MAGQDAGAGAASRRLLQVVVAMLYLVPLAAGGAGVRLGPGFVGSAIPGRSSDLDSHFRYLSGIFLGVGLTFLSTVPGIERRTARFRLAAALVVCDGSRIVGNLAIDAQGDGISVFSSGNVARANRVFSNGDDGIIVTATSSGNRIVNNRALGNATDLTDQNSGCNDNVWTGNVFASADPDDCID